MGIERFLGESSFAMDPLHRRQRSQAGRLGAATVLALSAACATGQWRSQRADDPLTRSELSSRNLSVADDAHYPALSAAFARALASEGFNVVDHPPYHEDLEVTLSVVRRTDGDLVNATLRSDGFFIDEVKARPDDTAPAALARALAVSQGMADFVHNSGTPQQRNLSGQ